MANNDEIKLRMQKLQSSLNNIKLNPKKFLKNMHYKDNFSAIKRIVDNLLYGGDQKEQQTNVSDRIFSTTEIRPAMFSQSVNYTSEVISYI